MTTPKTREAPKALPTLHRTLAIALDGFASRADTADERIPIALSSENPVERWFGEEILDHGKGAVDLSRAENGLPLLLDHSTRDQIGVIEEVSLGDDKVIRGLMRFSRSPRAQEIRQDVLDGIRSNASIGYQIRELKLEKSDKKSGMDTYRATQWALLEGSIVAVPADPSVGVGRGADEGAAFPVRIVSPEPAPEARSVTVDPKDKDPAAHNGAAPGGGTAVTEVRDRGAGAGAPPADTRAADLAALAEQYGAGAELSGWIRSGKSLGEVKDELLQRLAKNARPMLAPVVELSDKEQRKYSMARLIAATAARQLGERFEDDGFEREVSQEIEKHLPDNYRRQGGFFVPTNLRNLPQFASRAGLDSGTATKGAELKFTEQGEFIDMLRARMQVRQLGARTLSGLVGPVLFPKQTAAGTFTMVGENPGADVAESNLLLGTVALNPKTGQSTTSFSKQLLAQVRTPDVEGLVREDLAKEHALGIEGQAISGSGTGNNCTGLTATAGIGSVAGGTNGAAPTWDNIVDLETAIAAANADVATMGYLTTPGIRGKLKKTQQFATTNGLSVWQSGEQPLNGYRAAVSTKVPSTLTKGTAAGICHAILFGDWSQMIIGEWGALELIVDPYRLKKQGMVEVTSFQMFGIAIRQAAAFAAMLDALAT